MLPSTGETVGEIVTKSAKEQEQNLKKKYKFNFKFENMSYNRKVSNILK